MGDLITIIVTGGGAPGIAGTISALRNNPDHRPVRIIATDIADDVVGRWMADGFHCVPAPEDAGYLDAMLDVARQEGADAILPQTTREIMTLSANHDTIRAAGIALVLSSGRAIATANDKYLLLEQARELDVPCPDYRLTDSEETFTAAAAMFGYPKRKVAVKPRLSNGMRGLRILSAEPWDVRRFLSEKPAGVEIERDALLAILRNGNWPEMLVSEYLPGQEYTVDAFRGARGTVVIPRLRERIRSGITFDARVELRNDLIEYSTRLAVALDLKYCFGFQFKLDATGVPKLLESNPRVQGTMAASSFAGFNVIYHAVREALGDAVDVSAIALNDGLAFKRYWGGTGIYDGKPIGKI